MSPRNPFRRWQQLKLDRTMLAQIARVEKFLETQPQPAADAAPVILFNASTRIHRVSLNAAYSLLAGWVLRANGQPVRHLVCDHGMLQCILGARPGQPTATPPCSSCTRLSSLLFPEHLTLPLHPKQGKAAAILEELAGATAPQMMDWTHQGVPYGQLVLPGLRWVLRRHNLVDDEKTRAFYRQFLASAVSLKETFEETIERVQPKAAIVFNGVFFPEALLRYVARERNISTITHEVGLRPFSAFFSHQDATFRQVDIDAGSELDEDEGNALDQYLESRFRGEFSMAGIRFWESMQDLPAETKQKLGRYPSYVPIFTNVIFDTSQIHANTIFEDMYEWLDGLKPVIADRSEILFIIRAHPDEDRPGKASQESVADWFAQSGLHEHENVVCIPPEEAVSSYQLIEGAKFVLVYNSSIGLEASILGKPVLCAGQARYTQADTVNFPATQSGYWIELENMLSSEANPVPARYSQNARRFLHAELFRASLDLADFLQEDPTLPGMVIFKEFNPSELLSSSTLEVIFHGIVDGSQFLQQP